MGYCKKIKSFKIMKLVTAILGYIVSFTISDIQDIELDKTHNKLQDRVLVQK